MASIGSVNVCVVMRISVKAKQGAVGRFDIYILPLRTLAA